MVAQSGYAKVSYEIWVTFLGFGALKNTKSPFYAGLLGYFSKQPHENLDITTS
jgi:hypothetical protein